MIICTNHEEAAGASVRCIPAPDMENVLLNMSDGHVPRPGAPPESTCLRHGAVVEMLPRPQGKHSLSGTAREQWVDPRTPTDIQRALCTSRQAACWTRASC